MPIWVIVNPASGPGRQVDANYTKAMKDGLIRQQRIPRQAAATNMRIVVRDVGTGSVGSLTIPFSQIAGQPH